MVNYPITDVYFVHIVPAYCHFGNVCMPKSPKWRFWNAKIAKMAIGRPNMYEIHLGYGITINLEKITKIVKIVADLSVRFGITSPTSYILHATSYILHPASYI